MISLMEPTRISHDTTATDAPWLFRRRDDATEIYRVVPISRGRVEVQVLTPKWEFHEWRRGFICRMNDFRRFLTDEIRGWEPIDAAALPTPVLGVR